MADKFFDELLIHSATVRTYSAATVDTHGHNVETWADTYTSVPCRVVPSGGRELKVGIEIVISTHVIFFKPGQAITARDEVVVSSKTYQVLLVEDANDESELHHREAVCELLS